MDKNKKVICPYCSKEFKRITKNHLDKHNVSFEEYQKEYEPVKYMENLIIEFFNEYYITFRTKYLLYTSDGATYTVNSNKSIKRIDNEGQEVDHKPIPLVKTQLQKHLRHKHTIGIFFPSLGTKLIGLDLDIQDIDALNKTYETLLNYIDAENMLITSSGGKGYHIDIFLNKILSRDLVKKFYELILYDTGLTSKQLELRGANEQGWKLPFGVHFKKNAYCAAVNEFGIAINHEKLEGLIKSKVKTDVNKIIDAILINEHYNNDGSITEESETLTDTEIIEFEEITNEVNILSSYSNLNEDFIEDLAIIYRKGFEGSGFRSKYTFKVALLLKSHMRFNKKVVLEEMNEWKERCTGYRATEKEFEEDIKKTVDKIFKDDLKLTIAAREIKISKVEIKEILSINCRTSQESRALRLLYYMFFLHSKAYSSDDGIFFMTLEQMQAMGARKNKTELLNQINKLNELGKIYRFPTKRVSRTKFAPSEYKLVSLSGVTIKIGTKTFDICNDASKCKDCLDRATDFLITTRTERQQYRKGKCLECPYNKR